VNVHIGRLRRCLRIEGAPDPIRTVRGIGYGIGSVSLPERRARWRAKP
jgi:two-component system phosphate regulon response regulator PhoB